MPPSVAVSELADQSDAQILKGKGAGLSPESQQREPAKALQNMIATNSRTRSQVQSLKDLQVHAGQARSTIALFLQTVEAYAIEENLRTSLSQSIEDHGIGDKGPSTRHLIRVHADMIDNFNLFECALNTFVPFVPPGLRIRILQKRTTLKESILQISNAMLEILEKRGKQIRDKQILMLPTSLFVFDPAQSLDAIALDPTILSQSASIAPLQTTQSQDMSSTSILLRLKEWEAIAMIPQELYEWVRGWLDRITKTRPELPPQLSRSSTALQGLKQALQTTRSSPGGSSLLLLSGISFEQHLVASPPEPASNLTVDTNIGRPQEVCCHYTDVIESPSPVSDAIPSEPTQSVAQAQEVSIIQQPLKDHMPPWIFTVDPNTLYSNYNACQEHLTTFIVSARTFRDLRQLIDSTLSVTLRPSLLLYLLHGWSLLSTSADYQQVQIKVLRNRSPSQRLSIDTEDSSPILKKAKGWFKSKKESRDGAGYGLLGRYYSDRLQEMQLSGEVLSPQVKQKKKNRACSIGKELDNIMMTSKAAQYSSHGLSKQSLAASQESLALPPSCITEDGFPLLVLIPLVDSMPPKVVILDEPLLIDRLDMSPKSQVVSRAHLEFSYDTRMKCFRMRETSPDSTTFINGKRVPGSSYKKRYAATVSKHGQSLNPSQSGAMNTREFTASSIPALNDASLPEWTWMRVQSGDIIQMGYDLHRTKEFPKVPARFSSVSFVVLASFVVQQQAFQWQVWLEENQREILLSVPAWSASIQDLRWSNSEAGTRPFYIEERVIPDDPESPDRDFHYLTKEDMGKSGVAKVNILRHIKETRERNFSRRWKWITQNKRKFGGVSILEKTIRNTQNLFLPAQISIFGEQQPGEQCKRDLGNPLSAPPAINLHSAMLCSEDGVPSLNPCAPPPYCMPHNLSITGFPVPFCSYCYYGHPHVGDTKLHPAEMRLPAAVRPKHYSPTTREHPAMFDLLQPAFPDNILLDDSTEKEAENQLPVKSVRLILPLSTPFAALAYKTKNQEARLGSIDRIMQRITNAASKSIEFGLEVPRDYLLLFKAGKKHINLELWTDLRLKCSLKVKNRDLKLLLGELDPKNGLNRTESTKSCAFWSQRPKSRIPLDLDPKGNSYVEYRFSGHYYVMPVSRDFCTRYAIVQSPQAAFEAKQVDEMCRIDYHGFVLFWGGVLYPVVVDAQGKVGIMRRVSLGHSGRDATSSEELVCSDGLAVRWDPSGKNLVFVSVDAQQMSKYDEEVRALPKKENSSPLDLVMKSMARLLFETGCPLLNLDHYVIADVDSRAPAVSDPPATPVLGSSPVTATRGPSSFGSAELFIQENKQMQMESILAMLEHLKTEGEIPSYPSTGIQEQRMVEQYYQWIGESNIRAAPIPSYPGQGVAYGKEGQQSHLMLRMSSSIVQQQDDRPELSAMLCMVMQLVYHHSIRSGFYSLEKTSSAQSAQPQYLLCDLPKEVKNARASKKSGREVPTVRVMYGVDYIPSHFLTEMNE